MGYKRIAVLIWSRARNSSLYVLKKTFSSISTFPNTLIFCHPSATYTFSGKLFGSLVTYADSFGVFFDTVFESAV